jgi:uncharacterized protein (TIGR03435 family)
MAAPAGGRVGQEINGNQVSFGFRSLRELISIAYSVPAQLLTAPDWMDQARYDIVALMPDGSRRGQVPAMLQALLIDRFRLVVRKEQRVQEVYAILEAKGGHTMRVAPPEDKPAISIVDGVMRVQVNQTMAELAVVLSGLKDLPVVDRTGLDGTFVVVMEVSTESPGAAGPAGTTAAVPGGGMVVTLEKMGLRLERRKEAVPYLNVVSAEKTPTEN